MQRILVAALSFAFLVAVGGCKSHDKDMDHDHDSDMSRSGSTEMKSGSTAAGADQCQHCEGKQTLNADGTCPACKMKMK